MVLQLSNREINNNEVADADDLLAELISSLILDSDSKIGATFARVLKSLSDSMGCFVLISPDELARGSKLFVGSDGHSGFFNKFASLASSLGFIADFETVESFLRTYGVELGAKRSMVVKDSTEYSSLYFKPILEEDGSHIGLIALEVMDGQEPHVTDIFRAAITSLVNRTNTHNFLGVKFPPVSEVVAGLAHDLRGGLALIGMQNELSRFQGSSPSELGLARERISSGVATVESASERLQGFIELLFPPFYAANNCSPVNALYAAIISLPWNQETKSLIKTEIDAEVHKARIEVSGAITYWVYRSLISFFADPRQANSSLNQIDVKLGIEADNSKSVFLSVSTPAFSVNQDTNTGQVKKVEEPTEGLVIMSRARAFDLWARRVGFETKFTTLNRAIEYKISINNEK